MKRLIYTMTMFMIAISLFGCDLLKQKMIGSGTLGTLAAESIASDTVYQFEVRNIETDLNHIEIQIIPGDVTGVTVTADDNILETLDISIAENQIKISGSRRYRYRPTQLLIEIVNTKVNRYDIQGAASFVADDPIMVNSLEIQAQGAVNGSINAKGITDTIHVDIDGVIDFTMDDLEANLLEVDIDGTGNFDFSGTGNVVKLDINGVSNVSAKRLIAKECTLTVQGLSNLTVNATEKLDITAKGTGSIHYLGNPSLSTSVQGMVTVTKIE